MSKLRSLNTAFWSDSWVEVLNPEEKLLFIYLITNEKTNMLGIYEASVKKISFETGIEAGKVQIYLERFREKGKVKHDENYVILENYLKHQNYNPNMQKSAIDSYNNLPDTLKFAGKELNKKDLSKSWETLCKAFDKHSVTVRKIEVEVEAEVEDEFKFNNNININPEPPEEKSGASVKIDNTTFSKTSSSSAQWIESLAMQKKVPKDAVKLFITQFEQHLIVMEEQKKSLKDFKTHFVHWFNKQPLAGLVEKPVGRTNQSTYAR